MKKIRVGAAQISPFYFDKEKTLEKTCHYIGEAGRLGLDLVVFLEVYFCGYPFWRGGVSVRQHAIENQVFVISSNWYLGESDIPSELKDVMKYNLAKGGSLVVNPAGIIIEGPVFNEETIVHAEIDLDARELAKAYFDGIGHYSRPDLLSLRIRDEAWTPSGPEKL